MPSLRSDCTIKLGSGEVGNEVLEGGGGLVTLAALQQEGGGGLDALQQEGGGGLVAAVLAVLHEDFGGGLVAVVPAAPKHPASNAGIQSGIDNFVGV